MITYKKIFYLSLPIILANVSVPIQGMIDMGLMGRLGQSFYINSVGLSIQFFSILFVSFNFLQYATSGLSSQASGSGDVNRLFNTFFRSLLIAIAIGLIMIALKYPINNFAISFFSPSEVVANKMQQYISVRIIGSAMELSNFVFIGFFAGLGLSKNLLKHQLAITVSNIIFSVIFITYFKYDVSGVAAGTLIANLIGFIVGFYLIYKEYLANYKKEYIFDYKKILVLSEIKSIMKLNKDIFIRTVILTLSFAWIAKLGIMQGESLLAVNMILLQILYFASFSLDGVAVATEGMAGKAIGENNKELFLQVIKKTTKASFIIALFLSFLAYILMPTFLTTMTNDNELIKLAQKYKYWAIFIPLGAVLAYQLDGIFTAATAGAEIRNSMIIVGFVFFPTSYLLSSVLANNGIWLSIYLLMFLRVLTLSLNLKKVIARLDYVV